MQIELEIKNYRAFSDQEPVRLRLSPGFTALVGVNNAGKSTLLRFFHEFRPLFEGLATHGRVDLINALNRRRDGSPLAVDAMMHNGNERDLSIRLKIDGGESARRDVAVIITDIRLLFHRDGTWTVKLAEVPQKYLGNLQITLT